MVHISTLNYDIWYYMSLNYLDAQDFKNLTQCNKYLNQLRQIDIIWKHYCSQEYKLHYNHPDQSYRDLYHQCQKHRPCHHLQHVSLDVPENLEAVWRDQNRCQRCMVDGIENLYICLSCQEIYCDRHAKLHMRNTRSTDNDHEEEGHVIFYKPNISEIYCEACVEWTGGLDSNRAERFYSDLISSLYLIRLFDNDMAARILECKTRRQKERMIRWKDTAQYIVTNERGYCFIDSLWVTEWEMFVEGWATEPPLHAPIDQQSLLQCILKNLEEDEQPEVTSENVTLMSMDAWDYVSQAYTVIGNQITIDDLKPDKMAPQIAKRIRFWKQRAFC